MKKLIHEVIKLDQQAQEQILKLKKEKEELFLSFKQMKQELTEKNRLEILEQTKVLEADAKILFEERILAYQEKTHIKEKNILDQYEKNKEVWINDLMKYILGELN
ncbi:Uncharacterised protein [Acholeplasma oculi]|uniref:Uncharacterized protein n=1 Tax=Acholeplasma oculi TaxID=35623 RepID=A0A061A927_9MOLU|nr:hypothetical protein [Acholeplasma oculi]CDR30390.1 hypothetical protein Aocu_03170 [Acholeplasma oculi]SKC41870.1 hypothetical protein SAMN02745122_0854 [Acholeplasma oculi]SUT88924.1 Uncharacterised protein [Acholeplasma oculi]